MARKRIYYPSGVIEKGLITKGGEWMTEDGIEYIGQYHKYTNTNEVYTDAFYINGKSTKLVPYIESQSNIVKSTYEYDKLKNTLNREFNIVTPDPYRFKPTINDYQIGYATRYFMKRNGGNTIYEISKDDYSKLKNELFQKIELRWKLSGGAYDNGTNNPGVYDTNYRTVQKFKYEFIGIDGYLTDFLEFAKIN